MQSINPNKSYVALEAVFDLELLLPPTHKNIIFIIKNITPIAASAE